MKFKRNAKFWGIKFTQEFLDSFNRTNRLLNDISNKVRKDILNGVITNIEASSLEQYVHINGEKLTRAKYKDRIANLFEKYECINKVEGLKRDLVGYVLERYAGYYKRNTQKKVPRITIKGKSLYFKGAVLKINTEDKTIELPTLWGKLTLKYQNSKKEDCIDPKTKYGGNFVIKQSCLVVAVDVEKEPLYVPVGELGFDLNKTASDWIVLSDGETIPRDGQLEEYTQQIKILNKEIDNKNKKKLKSSQRSAVRRKVRNKHKQQSNEIDKIARKIVDKAKDQKLLLCLDSVKTGQKMGTFGQDKLIPQIQTICENEGVPFYVVPCKNTSRRCPSCGYTDELNRVTTEMFHCLECHYQNSAHMVGAENIAFQGSRLLNSNIPYGDYKRRSVDKLVSQSPENVS